MGYEVLGTLDDPLHAVNLEERISEIDKKKTIVAIDACLGYSTSVGRIDIDKGPLRPGAGVYKELPPVGDLHIKGIVNVGGFMEYMVLQNTRLSLVMKMADEIVQAITDILPTPYMQEVATAKYKE